MFPNAHRDNRFGAPPGSVPGKHVCKRIVSALKKEERSGTQLRAANLGLKAPQGANRYGEQKKRHREADGGGEKASKEETNKKKEEGKAERGEEEGNRA